MEALFGRPLGWPGWPAVMRTPWAHLALGVAVVWVCVLSAGIERTVTRPLGSGLGTSSATAIRFDVPNGLQTENFYLRLGVEMGLLGTLGSAALVVWVLRLLWRRAQRVRGPTVGAVASLAAAAAGAMVLETFSELSLSWTVWLLVGLALPARSEDQDALVASSRVWSAR